jgi:hypothetical protein
MSSKPSSELLRYIYKGDLSAFDAYLSQLPETETLYLENEPYCNIQRKSSVECFKRLLKDPRFQWDDLFIARQLYFSTHQVHETLRENPRFWRVVNKKKSFMEYVHLRYKRKDGGIYEGMYQRYIRVDDLVIKWRPKEDRFRLAFHLYPFLIFVIRGFLKRYYAPGRKGYLSTQERFLASV